MRAALIGSAVAFGALLVGGAVWLTIERGPALLLDLAKLPWCG